MRNLNQCLAGLVIAALSLQMAACGTILYPERKGQKSGRLDIGVVLLDGVGVLCFIIPGVIAYVVDFNNGTIYVPGTKAKEAGPDRQDIKTVEFDALNLTPDVLRNIIREETGYNPDWQDKRLRVIKLKNKDEISFYLARAARSTPAGANLLSSR